MTATRTRVDPPAGETSLDNRLVNRRSSSAKVVGQCASYALVEAGDPEAIDVYLSEDEAQRALADCLADEPDWRGLLRVEPIELAGIDTSAN